MFPYDVGLEPTCGVPPRFTRGTLCPRCVAGRFLVPLQAVEAGLRYGALSGQIEWTAPYFASAAVVRALRRWAAPGSVGWVRRHRLRRLDAATAAAWRALQALSPDGASPQRAIWRDAVVTLRALREALGLAMLPYAAPGDGLTEPTPLPEEMPPYAAPGFDGPAEAPPLPEEILP